MCFRSISCVTHDTRSRRHAWYLQEEQRRAVITSLWQFPPRFHCRSFKNILLSYVRRKRRPVSRRHEYFSGCPRLLSDCTSTHEAPGSHSNAVTSHQGQKGRDPRRPGWPPRTAPRSRDLQHSIRVEEQLQDGRHQLHINK